MAVKSGDLKMKGVAVELDRPRRIKYTLNKNVNNFSYYLMDQEIVSKLKIYPEVVQTVRKKIEDLDNQAKLNDFTLELLVNA